MIEVALTINGHLARVGVDPGDRLLDVLRYRLGLPGTKEGCGEGECGACTVLMDGVPVNSCLVPAWQARGRQVETVESTDAASVEPLHRCGATQCGACTPGVVMTTRWIAANPRLLKHFPARHLMAGNLCRCTGYDGIIDAVHEVVAKT